MHKRGWLYPVALLTGALTICWTGGAAARQNVFIGGIGTGYSFWERDYDDETTAGVEEDSGDRRDFMVWPDLNFQSLGEHNGLFLHYSPVLTYDDLNSETDVDHYLDLRWEQQLSRQLRFSLRDDFVYSSDPARYGSAFEPGLGEEDDTVVDPADGLTQNLGPVRYWTNSLNLFTGYTYADESDVELEYNFRILRNDSGITGDTQYNEYDRHGIGGRWAHRYSPSWKSELGLYYTAGIFEEDGPEGLSQDVDEYRADLEFDYFTRPNSFYPLIYRYQQAQYEDLRDDVWGNELSVGWDYTPDSRNHFVVGAGPSYVKSEDLGGELGYNAYLNYVRTYQFGSLDGLINKRYVARNFTGTSDAGFADVVDIRLGGSYRLRSDLTVDGFAMYRHEEILDPQGIYYDAALGSFDPANERDLGDVTYTREGYSLGAGVNYTFLRWFTASLSYVYYQQDGDVSADAYEDHRVLLQLTWSKELWRKS